jgi:hypothetical protein
VTEVADAMDERKPIEIDLSVAYGHQRRDTKITRENLQADSAGNKSIVLVDELTHTQVQDDLQFRLAVGIFRDLELHALAPLVLRNRQSWDFATVNGQSVAPTSTLANNRLDISGCLTPGSCQTVSPIVPTPGRSTRSGFANPTIGIAWAPINDEREARLRPDLYPPGKPVATWALGFDYTLPLPGDVDDPSKFGSNTLGTTSNVSGPVLRKAHTFAAWTAFSKRFKVADPYVLLRGSAPVAVGSSGVGDGAYQNCWHPEQLSNVAAVNCADPAWKTQTGYQPPYQAGFALGTELVLHDDPLARQKFAIDVRADVQYTGPARDYTQVTDALGKLTYADEFVGGLATLALYGRAASWFQMRVSGSVGVESAHFLTSEPIGKDLNGDGRIQLSNGQKGSLEQNPTYDFRLDQPGRRLRAEPALVWGVAGTMALTF